MSEEKVKIEEYISLHENGIPISKIKPIDDQTFKTLKECNVDIRIIDRDKNLSRLYNLGQLGTFTKDTVKHSHRYFYSIPLQTVNGTIVGFIYRTVYGKSYTTVSRSFLDKEHKVPLMFGFYKDFADYDQNDQCKPIIVCEGLKDCITLKKIYPYVLSNNTSHMGINLQVLSNLTNKFILIYDNDKAGQEGTLEDINKAQKMKYNVIEIKIGNGYKDITDCLDNPTYFATLKTQLLDSIKALDTNYIKDSYIGRTSMISR
jgi:DNA primase